MHNILGYLARGIGHLFLLVGFSGFVTWYALDAWRAQSEVENMLLIGPVSGLVLIVMVGIAIGLIREMMQGASGPGRAAPQIDPAAPAPDSPDADTLRGRYGAVLSAGFLGVYVVSMPLIGFDIATAVFVAANMVLQGERNVLLIVFFSALVAILPVLAIEHLLSVPVPTMLLP